MPVDRVSFWLMEFSMVWMADFETAITSILNAVSSTLRNLVTSHQNTAYSQGVKWLKKASSALTGETTNTVMTTQSSFAFSRAHNDLPRRGSQKACYLGVLLGTGGEVVDRRLKKLVDKGLNHFVQRRFNLGTITINKEEY